MMTGPSVLKTCFIPSSTSQAERAELGAAVVDGRAVHRPQDAVGHVGRAGDLQEMAAARCGMSRNLPAACRSAGRGRPTIFLQYTNTNLQYCIQLFPDTWQLAVCNHCIVNGKSATCAARTGRFQAHEPDIPAFGDSALAARLRREIEGEVLFDRFTRGRYSTDASIYQIEPIGVVVPRSARTTSPRHPDRRR